VSSETEKKQSVTQRISERERGYVQEVLDSQFRSSSGSAMTKRLESKFAEIFQSKFAISFINGTATLHAALAAAGIGPGDEVIVPPLTMSSTAFAVLHAGAVPVFADINARTWTIDPASILACITPRTRAIIPVAIYGLPSDSDVIMDIGRRHNLFVLDDDAQCVIGQCRGRIVGSIAHASSFSFQSSKHITAGEGGMVTTNDEQLAERIRRFNSLGYGAVGAGKAKISKSDIQDPSYERHVSVGWNYRMPELCAAVLLGQVERIHELVSARVANASLFTEAARSCDWLTPQMVPKDFVHSYWTFVASLNGKKSVPWRQFHSKYIELGGDGIYGAWQLTYLEPAFRGKKFSPDQWQKFGPGLCPVAESVQPTLLQFKTNYLNPALAQAKAEALARTIQHFNGRAAGAA
jgi:perosamine synthetase